MSGLIPQSLFRGGHTGSIYLKNGHSLHSRISYMVLFIDLIHDSGSLLVNTTFAFGNAATSSFAKFTHGISVTACQSEHILALIILYLTISDIK